MKPACLVTTALLLLAISPAGTAQDDEDNEDASTAKVCVNTRVIRTFDAFSDRHVYVQEGSNKHFLFTMRNRCHGLRNSLGIAIKDTTSRVCSEGFGEIVYRDRMSSSRMQSCRIGTIVAVDSREDAKALADAAEKSE